MFVRPSPPLQRLEERQLPRGPSFGRRCAHFESPTPCRLVQMSKPRQKSKQKLRSSGYLVSLRPDTDRRLKLWNCLRAERWYDRTGVDQPLLAARHVQARKRRSINDLFFREVDGSSRV